MMRNKTQWAGHEAMRMSDRLICRALTFVHRFCFALLVMTVSLGIALPVVSGSEALASDCTYCGGKGSQGLWRVAALEKAEECLSDSNSETPVEDGQTPPDLALYRSFLALILPDLSATDSLRIHFEFLPTETRLIIPQWVRERYEKVKHKWDRIWTYWSIQYFVSGPSVIEKRVSTMYLPLSRQCGANEETILVDIMNFHSIDLDRRDVFITLSDTFALNVTGSIREFWGDSP